MKEKNNTTQKVEHEILLPIKSFYTPQDRFELYSINEDGSLKNILTWENKPFENEKCLLDVLLGKESTTVNQDVLSEIRSFFGIVRQAGFIPDPPYNFRISTNADLCYPLAAFVDIQKKHNNTQEYISL